MTTQAETKVDTKADTQAAVHSSRDDEAVRAVWDDLAARGQVSGERPLAVHTPWAIRQLSGAGGWLAALFLQLFLLGAVFVAARENAVAIAVCGAGMIGVAAWVYRVRPGAPAFEQFGLAFSLAGQGLAIYGASLMLGGERVVESGGFWALIATFQALLYVLVPNYLHRQFNAVGFLLAVQLAMSLHAAPAAGRALEAQQALIGTQRFAGMHAHELRNAMIIEADHGHAFTRQRGRPGVTRPAWPGDAIVGKHGVGHGEIQRHVVALHQRAGVHWCEAQIDRVAVGQQVLLAEDTNAGQQKRNEPGGHDPTLRAPRWRGGRRCRCRIRRRCHHAALPACSSTCPRNNQARASSTATPAPASVTDLASSVHDSAE
jgi:hypothetical protein